MPLGVRKETLSMTTSLLSSAFLSAAVVSSDVTVGVAGGMALWTTSVVSSVLTGCWAKQSRENGSTAKDKDKDQETWQDLIDDFIMFDSLDGDLGMTVTALALALITSPITAPAYAIYQRCKSPAPTPQVT